MKCKSCGMTMAKGRGGMPCCVAARGRGGVPVKARAMGGPIQGIGLGGGFLSMDLPGNRFGFKRGGNIRPSLF